MEKYLYRCFELAKKGLGNVAPNPMVGAVLVYNERIIGEGYHQQYGEAHAEVNCINSVKESDKQFISKATIYVSLEPCAHFGKTPPCANLIIKNKIPKVVLACKDPFAKVNGKGIDLLKNAGIEVVIASEKLQKEAQFLMRRFITFHTQKRPYTILKWAESKDGFIGKKEEEITISNNLSKRLNHKWRAEEAAILVGEQTILTDNPNLTVRSYFGKTPLRIAFQKYNEFLPHFNILNNEAETFLFSGLQNQVVPSKHSKINISANKQNFIPEMLNYLHKKNINSLIVEGGASLLNSFIKQGLYDEVRIFKGNTKLKNGIKAPFFNNGFDVATSIGNNKLLIHYT